MLEMKMKNCIDANEISLETKGLDIAYCAVGSKGINDQPGDGLKKGRNM